MTTFERGRERKQMTLLMGMPVFVVIAMFPWNGPSAQSSAPCTGMDLTCVEEDWDPHIGSCLRFSYKRIALAGRDADNMRTGWYRYSHRGGGLLPLDPTKSRGTRYYIAPLNSLATFDEPFDEVRACLLYEYSLCTSNFEDVGICLADQRLQRLFDECDVTLRKGPVLEDSTAQWYGTSAEFEGVVPLRTLPTPTTRGFPSRGYDRYGGAFEVLRWLELAEANGVERVNICALRAAHACFTEGEHAGDASVCAAPLLGANER